MTINYDKTNKLVGWLVFAIALTIFWSTVEPTTSYWDAGEYIATSSKLEVGHPPGAPLYQMMGAAFSVFALEASDIAYTVNLLSVFSSAFTILFMFWSLTLLLKRHILKDKVDDIMILGAAAIGSLTFAVTDSFWFNAVEAEVYAAAALLMSLMFYLGLLWERDMMLPRGNRWLVLISFIVGLSSGIHFLGFLTIPAIGLLWYFRHYQKITPLNFIMANIAVVAVLLFVFKLLLPNTLAIFGYLEVFFVNEIGLPFNSGTVIALFLIIGLFVYLISLSRKRNLPLFNTITICVMFILIGFSSWVMLPIRANAGTPINENNPNDARALLAYFNREQYPQPALFYGKAFTDMYAGLNPDDPTTEDNESYKDEAPKYERDYEKGEYIIVNNYKEALQNTHEDHQGLLPRMTDGSRATNYVRFMGGLDYTITPGMESNPELLSILDDHERQFTRERIDADEYIEILSYLEQEGAITINKPSFMQNMRYLAQYQISYMYMRYFMWNFVGRQNDIQGEWDRFNGNWLSGIKLIDEWNLGTQDELSDDMLNNKARNTYFFLPLILGLIGALFHFKNDQKSFYVTLVLFLFTGLAIIFYLNQSMFQVRERDYAYVGSFLVFSMWIGMGVYAVFELLRDLLSSKPAKIIALTACFAGAPLLMGFQNWDDHDRSDKYTALASAKKYLDSCLPNALIFTIGDNDTFPLWYAQEVEGYRTDVRVVCTSLLSTDWYMDDMKKQAWDSEPVPTTMEHSQYTYGTRDAIIFPGQERLQDIVKRAGSNYKVPDTVDLSAWMNWVKSEKEFTKGYFASNGYPDYTFPSKHIRIPVNKEAVLENGVVAQKDADKIVDEIIITINSSVVYKNRMFMLDIINANNWERPIYFSGGAFGDEDYIWMKNYLQMDGCAFRLVPIKTEPEDPRDPFDMGRIDPDYSYEVIKNWDWGNGGSPDIYHDPETRRNSVGYRSNVTRVAEALTKEGQNLKAEELLDLGMEHMPLDYYHHYSMIEPFVSGYYEVGNKKKAQKLLTAVNAKYTDELDHYKALTLEEQIEARMEIQAAIVRYNSLVETAVFYEDQEMIDKHAEVYNSYVKAFPRFFDDDFLIFAGKAGEVYPDSAAEMELRRLLEDDVDNLQPEVMMDTLDLEND
ncbi:MAG: DUF2723 domain-containing protein [Nonlabens sp.]